MRRTLFLLAAHLTLAPLTAHADGIDDFTLTNPYQTFTFSLPANPVPDFSYGYGNFEVHNTPIEVNGTPRTASAIGFYLAPLSGGLYFHYGPGNFEFNNSYSGASLFTISATGEYTFLTGTFPLINNHASDPTASITITPETPASVTPEPGTLTLLATGALGLLSAVRRRTSL